MSEPIDNKNNKTKENTENNNTLSDKAKENLRRNEELRQKDSKYIKIESAKDKVLHFNPEKIEPHESEYNGQKSMRYRYTVRDAEDSSNQEKYFEVAKGTSQEIDKYLKEGKTVLRIQRFGLSKDTRYYVTPA